MQVTRPAGRPAGRRANGVPRCPTPGHRAPGQRPRVPRLPHLFDDPHLGVAPHVDRVAERRLAGQEQRQLGIPPLLEVRVGAPVGRQFGAGRDAGVAGSGRARRPDPPLASGTSGCRPFAVRSARPGTPSPCLHDQRGLLSGPLRSEQGCLMTSELAERALGILQAHWRPEVGYCVPNPDTYPHQWLWDSAFHAVAWARLGDERGVEELGSLLDGQLDCGMVPHMRYGPTPPSAWLGPLAVHVVDHPAADVRARDRRAGAIRLRGARRRSDPRHPGAAVGPGQPPRRQRIDLHRAPVGGRQRSRTAVGRLGRARHHSRHLRPGGPLAVEPGTDAGRDHRRGRRGLRVRAGSWSARPRSTRTWRSTRGNWPP